MPVTRCSLCKVLAQLYSICISYNITAAQNRHNIEIRHYNMFPIIKIGHRDDALDYDIKETRNISTVFRVV